MSTWGCRGVLRYSARSKPQSLSLLSGQGIVTAPYLKGGTAHLLKRGFATSHCKGVDEQGRTICPQAPGAVVVSVLYRRTGAPELWWSFSPSAHRPREPWSCPFCTDAQAPRSGSCTIYGFSSCRWSVHMSQGVIHLCCLLSSRPSSHSDWLLINFPFALSCTMAFPRLSSASLQ